MSLPSTPAIVTDCVIIDQDSRILLVRRGSPPFKGKLALPGGFVDIGETVEDACRREVQEETGVEVAALQFVGVYSDPKRDPRGHTVSIAFVTHVDQVEPIAGDDAEGVAWVSDVQHLELAFDHRLIIEEAMRLQKAQAWMAELATGISL